MFFVVFVKRYLLTCVSGVIPVTFLVDNIGDSSLRMKYRYLGGQGTKPLAAALKVSVTFLHYAIQETRLQIKSKKWFNNNVSYLSES